MMRRSWCHWHEYCTVCTDPWDCVLWEVGRGLWDVELGSPS
jgi:hypothetical protein